MFGCPSRPTPFLYAVRITHRVQVPHRSKCSLNYTAKFTTRNSGQQCWPSIWKSPCKITHTHKFEICFLKFIFQNFYCYLLDFNPKRVFRIRKSLGRCRKPRKSWPFNSVAAKLIFSRKSLTQKEPFESERVLLGRTVWRRTSLLCKI